MLRAYVCTCPCAAGEFAQLEKEDIHGENRFIGLLCEMKTVNLLKRLFGSPLLQMGSPETPGDALQRQWQRIDKEHKENAYERSCVCVSSILQTAHYSESGVILTGLCQAAAQSVQSAVHQCSN